MSTAKRRSAGWYRAGSRRRRLARQVPPQDTWCQNAWFPALGWLMWGRHLPRCHLGCKFAGGPAGERRGGERARAGEEISNGQIVCKLTAGLECATRVDTQSRHTGRLWGPAPAYSLARCGGQTQHGTSGDSSLEGDARECVRQPREPAPRTVAGSKRLPALVDAFGSKRAIIISNGHE